jgi:hypothetical protein
MNARRYQPSGGSCPLFDARLSSESYLLSAAQGLGTAAGTRFLSEHVPFVREVKA